MINIRFNNKGFRICNCPVCGKEICVVGWLDDTRWRYENHTLAGTSEICVTSNELLPTGKEFRNDTN